MTFLLDQDVWTATAEFLLHLGHDVLLVSEIGQERAEDSVILDIAQAKQRILVTRDRDYGALVFVNRSGSGVIYLRITPSTLNTTHAELERCLSIYSQEQLRQAFLTVEPGRHRFRKLTSEA